MTVGVRCVFCQRDDVSYGEVRRVSAEKIRTMSDLRFVVVKETAWRCQLLWSQRGRLTSWCQMSVATTWCSRSSLPVTEYKISRSVSWRSGRTTSYVSLRQVGRRLTCGALLSRTRSPLWRDREWDRRVDVRWRDNDLVSHPLTSSTSAREGEWVDVRCRSRFWRRSLRNDYYEGHGVSYDAARQGEFRVDVRWPEKRRDVSSDVVLSWRCTQVFLLVLSLRLVLFFAFVIEMSWFFLPRGLIFTYSVWFVIEGISRPESKFSKFSEITLICNVSKIIATQISDEIQSKKTISKRRFLLFYTSSWTTSTRFFW